jgi:hypothetical protein
MALWTVQGQSVLLLAPLVHVKRCRPAAAGMICAPAAVTLCPWQCRAPRPLAPVMHAYTMHAHAHIGAPNAALVASPAVWCTAGGVALGAGGLLVEAGCDSCVGVVGQPPGLQRMHLCLKTSMALWHSCKGQYITQEPNTMCQ